MKIDKPMSITNLVVFFVAFAWLVISQFMVGDVFTGQIVFAVLGLFGGITMLNVIFLEKKIVALGVPMQLPTNPPTPPPNTMPVAPQFNEAPQQIPMRQPTEDEMIEQVVLTRLQQGNTLEAIVAILESAGKDKKQVIQIIEGMVQKGTIITKPPEPVKQVAPVAPVQEKPLPTETVEEPDGDTEISEEDKDDEPEDEQSKPKRIRERKEGKVTCSFPGCKKKFVNEDKMRRHYGMAHYKDLKV